MSGTTPDGYTVFRYPIYWYALDLEELAHLDSNIAGFGYNRFNVVSIYDTDYFFGSGSTPRASGNFS